MKKKWFAMLCAVFCTVLWGSAYPVIKYAYTVAEMPNVADKLMFAGVRFFLAGLMVLGIAWVKERRFPTVPKERIGGVVLYGVLQTGLMYILNYIGVANTTATKTSIITAASAFFAVLLAPLFFKGERITALKVIGVIVGMAGIVLVNNTALDGFSFMGEGLVFLSMLLNTAGSFVGKKVSKGIVFESTGYQLMIGGLLILAVAVPMGVVAIIYESRPNVTSDAAALALKSGNVCVLRCGKEAHGSAAAIVKALREGLAAAGLPEDMVLLIEDTTRQSANELMTADGYVDLLIPRGGKGLISAIVKNATVPCIQTGTGICHIYIDSTADIDMAVDIVENAKCSRPSVCNAEEVLVVAENVAADFLPKLKARIVDGRTENPVELRLDEKAAKIIDGTPAGENDFDTEFLDYILAVKTVKNVDEAIAHINAHSTGHSEAIVTRDEQAAEKFTRGVDSSSVYVNASTRFTDGGEFGLGCEMGISTQKLHARGPMGLEELNTYKYIIKGKGHIR